MSCEQIFPGKSIPFSVAKNELRNLYCCHSSHQLRNSYYFASTTMAEDAAEEEAIVSQNLLQQWAVGVQMATRKKPKIDSRLLPRNPKRKFRHDEALHCINRDYLGILGDPSTPIFAGSEFASMFRISRPRFQRMLEDFANSGDPFFTPPFVDALGEEEASLEARLLLPLKSISFGVPPKTFSDYFQMSKTLSKDCYNNFLSKLTDIYKDEYLRLPTEADVKAVTVGSTSYI